MAKKAEEKKVEATRFSDVEVGMEAMRHLAQTATCEETKMRAAEVLVFGAAAL